MIRWTLARNPILRREIDHRMRDNRTYFVPLVYASTLGLAVFGTYLTTVLSAGDRPLQGWRIGEAIFWLVVLTQTAFVVLLVPTISASSITGERDRGTLVPLLVTPIPRVRIVVGKLIASLLYVLLLLSTSLPFAALSFGFGGTDLLVLVATYASLLVTALFVAALGLMISCLIRRTVPSVLLTYGLLGLGAVGSVIGDVIRTTLWPEMELRPFFVYLNPFAGALGRVLPIGAGHIWLTPLLQIVLAAAFFTVAVARIRSMRE